MCFFGYWCCCFSFTKCHCLPISWLARFTMNYQTCWVNAVLCFIVTEQNHSELQTKLHFSEPELYLQTGQWYQFSPCIFIAHCAKKNKEAMGSSRTLLLAKVLCLCPCMRHRKETNWNWNPHLVRLSCHQQEHKALHMDGRWPVFHGRIQAAVSFSRGYLTSLGYKIRFKLKNYTLCSATLWQKNGMVFFYLRAHDRDTLPWLQDDLLVNQMAKKYACVRRVPHIHIRLNFVHCVFQILRL